MTIEKRTTPVTGASVWRGADLEPLEDQWSYRFSAEGLQVLERAHAAVADLPLLAIAREDFVIPELVDDLAAQAREIESGRGFALLRGLPVQRWGLEKSRRIYWGISQHIGQPISQTPRGELIYPVADRGVNPGDPDYRAPRGRSELTFHSDSGDVVGLLCMRPAKEGGVSRLASSMSIHNEMLREAPHLLDVLYRGYYVYRKNEQPVDEPAMSTERLPMLSYHKGELCMLSWSHWARSAAKVRGVPLSDEEEEALATVNRLASREDMVLDTHFQPGDIQYLNNYKVLHSRTEFTDWPEPERKRYLERVWLCTNPDREFAPGFADMHGVGSLLRGVAHVPEEVLAARGYFASRAELAKA